MTACFLCTCQHCDPLSTYREGGSAQETSTDRYQSDCCACIFQSKGCSPAEVALWLDVELVNADDRVVHPARAALAPANSEAT